MSPPAERRRGTPAFSARAFFLELAVYSVFIVIYFLLVLHFLGGWLKSLFDGHRTLYALVAIALIIGQSIVLEFLTRTLLRLFRPRTE